MHSCVALPQLLLFLKGFTESERNKLAMLTGILLANGNLSAAILSSLFNENLVKEGTSFSDTLAHLWVLVLTDIKKIETLAIKFDKLSRILSVL